MRHSASNALYPSPRCGALSPNVLGLISVNIRVFCVSVTSYLPEAVAQHSVQCKAVDFVMLVSKQVKGPTGSTVAHYTWHITCVWVGSTLPAHARVRHCTFQQQNEVAV